MLRNKNFQLLDFNNLLPKHIQRKIKKSVPSPDKLFRQIQCEVLKYKEAHPKDDLKDVYQQTKKILEKKLGTSKSRRLIGPEEEMKMRETITRCNQRKHLRQNKHNRTMSARDRLVTSRVGNLETMRAKDMQNGNLDQPDRVRSARPQTARVKHNRSNFLDQKYFTGKINTGSKILDNNLILVGNQQKQINLGKDFSSFDIKGSYLRKTQNQSSRGQSYFQLDIQSICSKKKKTQSRLKTEVQHSIPEIDRNTKIKNALKVRCNNLVNNCSNQMQDLKCVGQKVQYLELFSKKMNAQNSTIQKFYRKMEAVVKACEQWQQFQQN